MIAVQVSYAIGVAQPLSVHIDTYGTGTIPDQEILAKVLEKFDFRPGARRSSFVRSQAADVVQHQHPIMKRPSMSKINYVELARPQLRGRCCARHAFNHDVAASDNTC